MCAARSIHVGDCKSPLLARNLRFERVIEHLYFHIPFCPKLCPYCSFYVEVGSANKTTEFLDAVLREVEIAVHEREIRPRTIYFGGGTPSALTTAQLDYLFDGLHARLDLSRLEEWDLEANPATIRVDKARILRDSGVTRLSLGVQSWNDALLKTLGRVHDAAQAEETFHLLRDAGFENLNIDLMFAVPGQTLAQWEETLTRTLGLRPEHVSCYSLTYEEDTEYFRKLTGGLYVQDVELDAQLFETTMDLLPAGGLHQYEISNYARPGFESRHNLAYWQGQDYLGFGPSAFSTVGDQRWKNVADTAAYTHRVLHGESTAADEETLSPEIRRSEAAAFGIRMAAGLPTEFLRCWRPDLNEFFELKLIEEAGENTRLTRRGRLMADTVAQVFV